MLFLALAVTVLLASLRLLLPHWIDAYPQQAARLVGSYLNSPLRAGEISASWQGWRLILEARAVELPELDGRGSRARIELLRLELLPLSPPRRQWPSLRRAVVRGLLAELAPTTARGGAAPWRSGQLPGSFSVPELARSYGWLLPGKDLVFLDSELQWLPGADEHKPLPPLSIPSLRLQRRRGGILIDATAAPPASYGDPWRLRFDSRGPLHKGNGLLHIASEGLEPARWLPPGLAPEALRPTAGRLRGEARLDWHRGKLKLLQGRLAGDLRLQTAAGQLHLRQLNAQFAGNRDGEEWHYYGARIETMETDSGPWRPIELRLAQTPAGKERQLLLNRLALQKLPELLSLLPEQVLKKDWAARVPPNAVGELHNILLLPGRDDPRLELELAEVEWAGGKLLRRALGVSGRAWIDAGGIKARLRGREMVLNIPKLFDIPLELVRPQGVLHWEPEAERPRLRFLPATAQIAGARCKLHGALYWQDKRPAAADLYVRLQDATARDVLRHLPLKSDSKARQTMEAAIRSGKVRLGRIVYRGAFADFPFAANEGRFQTRFRLEESLVALRDDDSLPPIRDTSGSLEFDENSFRSEFASGNWNGLRVVGGRVEIRNMKQPQPEFQVRLQGDLESLREWPGAEGLRILPAGWSGGGEAEIEAHFRPSSARAASAWPMPEWGRLELRRGWLKPPAGPGLSDIRGAVEVRDGALTGKGLQVRYRGNPLRIHLRYRPEKAPRLVFTVRGKVSAEALAAEIERWWPADALPSFVAGRLQGASEWQATYRAHEETWRLELHSPLRGLAVRLPSPLGKTAAEDRPLSLRLEQTAAEARPALAWQYGRQLQGSHSRDARPQQPARFSVRGRIEALSAAEWSELLSELPRDRHAPPPSLLGDARLQFDRLELFGMQYRDLAAVVEAAPDAWRISLRSGELNGELHIPTRQDPTWTINLSHLSLLELESESLKAPRKPDVDPRAMPAVTVSVQELLRDGTALGTLHIATERIENGQDLRLKLESEGLLLEASGTWEHRGGEPRTVIELTLTASELERLYRILGALSPVQKAQTQLAMNLDWPGSPADYTLSTMQGTLDIDLGKGRLHDIQAGPSGLFGILSMQSLLRRLRLDFSDLFDVFRRGLSFDSITGRLRLEDGNAYTDDLTVRAPGLDIYISGRSGWAAQDYDQEVAAIPNLSSNWPIYGALFGGIPGAGIGGAVLLLDRWFGQGKANFDRILARKYRMTGSWDDPRIVPLWADLGQSEDNSSPRLPLGGGIPESR